MLMPAGLMKFGLAGKDLWHRLDLLRAGLETGSGLVLIRRELVAGSSISGRYRMGWIRDGVLLSVG
jgi:hypothetical protein